MATGPSLPYDIIIDIFSRLPVKTLTRLKSLSKHWLSLITNPTFITTHLHHSTYNPSLLIVRHPVKLNGHEIGISMLSNDLTTPHDVHMAFIHAHLYELGGHLEILSSCNGLLCITLSHFGRLMKIVLWNPATRELRKIPTSKVTKCPSGKYYSNSRYGFGFNRNINDYKLVRILYYYDNKMELGDLPVTKVEVFTWSTGVWKEIDDGLVQSGYYGDSITVNGFLYWKANGIRDMYNKKFILSFDMVDEVFNRISYPGSDQYNPEISRDLTVFKDALAMFVYPERESLSNTFELWTMNEPNGGARGQIWSKLYTFGPFSSISSPVGLWKDCEVIMKIEVENSRGLFLCDPNSQEISHFPTHGTKYNYMAHNYVESLVPVIGGNYVLEDAHMSY